MDRDDIKACPNCGAEIKDGMFKANFLLSDNQINLINKFAENPKDYYCSKCGDKLYEGTKDNIRKEIKELTRFVIDNLYRIPVISTHTPLNWDYEVIRMVTGQSTTGTGVITEFTSEFTDLFGAKSGRHNMKLKKGEDVCLGQLRKETLDLGGNAVIATDIDYSEIGSGRGILMVCMAGTAVNLKNTDVLHSNQGKKINELIEKYKRLNFLQSIL